MKPDSLFSRLHLLRRLDDYRCEIVSLSVADLYRQRAIAERAAAAAEPLPQRRQQQEQSARRWEELARLAEDTERRAEINEAEKRARSVTCYAQPDKD